MDKIKIFGFFEFYSSYTSTTNPIRSRKSIALLSYLVWHNDIAVSRSKLAGLLWEQFNEKRARHNLRQSILELKRHLPKDCIKSSRYSLQLDSSKLMCDLYQFRKCCQSDNVVDMKESLQIYQGDFMQDFYLGSALFDDWLEEKRFELHELMRNNMLQLLNHYISHNNTLDAMLLARRILRIDPLNENIHQVLMGLYAQQGRRSDAIKQYRQCQKLLADELDLKPNPQTKKLYEGIVSQYFSLMQNNNTYMEALGHLTR